MTEFEQILERLDDLSRKVEKVDALERAVNALRSEYSISQITYFENLSPSAVVGVDFVAYRFGCSQDAVIRGRFETNTIPRLRNKPLAFIKRDVEAVWMNLNKSVSEDAAKIRHKTKKEKRGKNNE